jgi:hypothetical protein
MGHFQRNQREIIYSQTLEAFFTSKLIILALRFVCIQIQYIEVFSVRILTGVNY